MDSEDENFESKLTGDVEAGKTLGKVASLGEIRVESNGELDHTEVVSPIRSPVGAGDGEGRGSVSLEEVRISFHGDAGENRELVGDGGDLVADSSSSPVGSPLASGDQAATPVSAAPKGYGLKKWRRIRRDVNKDETDPGADSVPIHKRRLPLMEPQKGREETENKRDSEDEGDGEGSVASVELKNPVGTPIMLPHTELGQLIACGFAIGIDSDNSEEQTIRSSTAASAPRLRHEIGFGRERSRTRNVGRGSGHVVQHKGQRSRGGTESGNKVTDCPIKIEKDNSYSSDGSNMRRTNAASAKWRSVVNNGKKSETSVDCDEEHSDDAQPGEEVQSGYGKENGGIENLCRENLNEANINKTENSQADSYVDPLLESISSLQAAQEALENEIQIFKESGKETMSDDSDDHFEENEGANSQVLEAYLVKLNEKIDELEHNLEEASLTLEVKESKVIELQTLLRETRQEELENKSLSALRQDIKDLEVEFENLLKKKIETENEYFVITNTTKTRKILQEDHNSLHEELKILAKDQKDRALKLTIAESKVNMLKVQNEEISKKQLEAKDISRLQNEVCKYSSCSFFQVVMLCIAFGLFFIRMLPSSTEFVVPT